MGTGGRGQTGRPVWFGARRAWTLSLQIAPISRGHGAGAWPLREAAHPRGQEGQLSPLRAGFLTQGGGPRGTDQASSCLAECGNPADCWPRGSLTPETPPSSCRHRERGAGTGLDAGQTHCAGGFSLSARQKEKEKAGPSLASSTQRGRCLWPGGSLPDSRGTLGCSLPQGGAQDPQALPQGSAGSPSAKMAVRPALLEGQGEAAGWGGRKSDRIVGLGLGGFQPLL